MNILWDSGNVGFGGCGINEWDRHVIGLLRDRGHNVTLIVDKLLEKRPKFKTWKPPKGGFTFVAERLTPHNYRETVSRLGEFDIQIGNHFTMFPVCDKVLPVVHDVEIFGREEYSFSTILALKGLGTKFHKFACTTPFVEEQVKRFVGSHVSTKCLYAGCKFSGLPVVDSLNRKPFIAYWGNRYAEGKNFNNLVKSMKFHDLSLKVAGFTGPADKELKLIQELNLEGRIEYHVGLSDQELYDLISQSCMYVCPSKYEGMGMPAMEAMSIGIPVVTSPCAALPSIVSGAGYIAKSASPRDLATTILDCLNNPLQTESYVQEGLNRSSFWTWDRCAEGIEELAEL